LDFEEKNGIIICLPQMLQGYFAARISHGIVRTTMVKALLPRGFTPSTKTKQTTHNQATTSPNLPDPEQFKDY
jgi:hypothetical protein